MAVRVQVPPRVQRSFDKTLFNRYLSKFFLLIKVTRPKHIDFEENFQIIRQNLGIRVIKKQHGHPCF